MSIIDRGLSLSPRRQRHLIIWMVILIVLAFAGARSEVHSHELHVIWQPVTVTPKPIAGHEETP